MRLFVAFDLGDVIRKQIALFAGKIRAFAPHARWVSTESLHVTLKFIGEKSESESKRIEQILQTVATSPFDITFRNSGFFPDHRAPRVFWAGIEDNAELNALALRIDRTLATLGIPVERDEYHPHLTLARSKGGSGSPRRQKSDAPNHSFESLQQQLAFNPPSEFGTMTAHEFFLYQSRLSSSGSKYTKLATFSLR